MLLVVAVIILQTVGSLKGVATLVKLKPPSFLVTETKRSTPITVRYFKKYL